MSPSTAPTTGVSRSERRWTYRSSRLPSRQSARTCHPVLGSQRHRLSRSTTRQAKSGRWSEAPTTQYPFNLATEGHRQPGSAFKPFTLAQALETGDYTPDSIINSAPQDFIVPNSGGKEHFIVHNFGNTYSGPITLTQATTVSDNSVYSQVGIHVGTKRIAKFAKQMGIRSPVSNNYAMILGGLRVGVTPLDLAHAYETFATGGRRVYNPRLGAPNEGPTGIAEIQCPGAVCGGSQDIKDEPQYERVLPADIAHTVHDILTTWSSRARAPRRGSPASMLPARLVRRPTTATPGSSGGPLS